MVYNNNINTDGNEMNVTPPKTTRNPIIAGAAIGAGASILGRILDFGNSKSQIKQQYENNLNLWREGANWDDYGNLVRRMVDAGLNPNLMFDKGALIQSGSPNGVDSGVGSSTFAGIGQDIAQVPQTALQLKAQELQSREIDIHKQDADTRLATMEFEREYKWALRDFTNEQKENVIQARAKIIAETDNLRATLDNLRQDLKFKQVSTAKINAEFEIYKKYQERYEIAKINNIISSTKLNLTNAKYAPMIANAALLGAKASMLSAKAAERNSFTNEFNAQTNWQEAQTHLEDLKRKIQDSEEYRRKSTAERAMIDAKITQGYWECVNGSINAVANSVSSGAKMIDAVVPF